MKKIIIIVGALLLAGLIAAGSFWAGMAYQTNKAEQARVNFFNSRGQLGEGQFPQGGELPFEGGLPGGGQFLPEGQMPGGGIFGRGGTIGEVKAIDGKVMTLSTAEDVTTVLLSEETQIEKTVTGTLSDLQPGLQLLVSGTRDEDGNLNASRVQILNEDAAFPRDNPPPGLEP